MALGCVRGRNPAGLLPAEFHAAPQFFYVFPVVLILFLAVLIIGDPGRIDRDLRWLLVTSGLMIAFMTFGTAAAPSDSSSAS